MARKKPPPATPPSTAPRQADIPPAPAGPKYLPQFAIAAAKLCKLGATDRDLAEAFGVSDRTIRNWKGEHEEFAQALELGKEFADKNVERSLYQRAVGYSHEAQKIYCEGGKVTKVEYIEHYPPETVACIFWLKNRRPDQWRDKVDILATVRPADVSGEPMTPDEWDREHSSRRPS